MTISNSTLLLAFVAITMTFVLDSSSAFVTQRPFAASSTSSTTTAIPTHHHMMDPSSFMDAATAASSTWMATPPPTSSIEAIEISSNLLAFTDQGQNLAGIFFQASLLPYLLFLYFLSFKANRISPLGNFGFQFVLLFVLSTIPSGIISRSVYGTSLANVDWLHGGAETLLTVANILIVSNECRMFCFVDGYTVHSLQGSGNKLRTFYFDSIAHGVLLCLCCSATGAWLQRLHDQSRSRTNGKATQSCIGRLCRFCCILCFGT